MGRLKTYAERKTALLSNLVFKEYFNVSRFEDKDISFEQFCIKSLYTYSMPTDFSQMELIAIAEPLLREAYDKLKNE